MEALVQEYLVDDDDQVEADGVGKSSREVDPMGDKYGIDLAGEDMIFFEKYGVQGGEDETYAEEDSFDNGYYF